mmetsp:Transcript_33117/g.98491  ORF Transcript_33117/g.98491 Transcript_33117/m.98491 type:complete len:81 (+) Transcript_33117:176-418(+)
MRVMDRTTVQRGGTTSNGAKKDTTRFPVYAAAANQQRETRDGRIDSIGFDDPTKAGMRNSSFRIYDISFECFAARFGFVC